MDRVVAYKAVARLVILSHQNFCQPNSYCNNKRIISRDSELIPLHFGTKIQEKWECGMRAFFFFFLAKNGNMTYHKHFNIWRLACTRNFALKKKAVEYSVPINNTFSRLSILTTFYEKNYSQMIFLHDLCKPILIDFKSS